MNGPPLALGMLELINHTGLTATTALTATNHRLGIGGSVQKTGTITGVIIRLGVITKNANNTTTLSVSLQDVDTANGPPGRPDGTADQTATVQNAALVSSTTVTATFGTSRSVTIGDLLAVNIEFGTFNAGDSIPTVVLTPATTTNALIGTAVTSHYNGTAWTAASGAPVLGLVYSDGSVSSLVGSLPVQTFSNVTTFNTGSTPDERGVRWVPSVGMNVAGLAANVDPDGDFDLVLYDSGGTALGTASFDANTVRAATVRWHQRLFSSPVAVSAGSTYYLIIKPTSATNIGTWSVAMNSAADRGAWPFGTDMDGATRTDAGAWTIESKDRVPIVPVVDLLASSGGVALPVVRAI